MGRLVTSAQWAAFKKLIRNGHDTFSQDTLVWRRAKRVIKRYREDGDVLAYENIPLKCLVGYNTFRTWPLTKHGETGELDDQNQLVYLNREYLRELGYLNSQGYLAFNPGVDEFFHRGSVYKAEGDTLASQAHDDPLLFLLVLRRKALLTSDEQFNVFIEIPLTIESGILDLDITALNISFDRTVGYIPSILPLIFNINEPVLGFGNTRLTATQGISINLLPPITNIPSNIPGELLESIIATNNPTITIRKRFVADSVDLITDLLTPVLGAGNTRVLNTQHLSANILIPQLNVGQAFIPSPQGITISTNPVVVSSNKLVPVSEWDMLMSLLDVTLPKQVQLSILSSGINLLTPQVYNSRTISITPTVESGTIDINNISIRIRKRYSVSSSVANTLELLAPTIVISKPTTVFAGANNLTIRIIAPQNDTFDQTFDVTFN